MDKQLFITIILGLILLTAIIYAIIYRRTKGENRRPPRYKALFIVGISWIPLGIGTENRTFWIVGLALMIVGLANKNKWKDEPKWADLSPPEKKMKITMLTVLIVLMIIGIILFLIK